MTKPEELPSKNTPPVVGDETNQELHSDSLTNSKTLGRLELLEERAVVNKERLDVGKVIATKHVRTKTVNVPIELVEEVLTIETTFESDDSRDLLTGEFDDKDVVRIVEPTLDSIATIKVNGKQIQLDDDPVEIVLSRQVAVVNKETYVVQEVTIDKSKHTHKDKIDVELKREELEVIEEGLLDHSNDKNILE